MKFLVLFACVAAASAQLVTYPNGAVAPAKTPEVQAAEAAHFAAKGAYAYAPGFYNGYYAGAWNGAYPYNSAMLDILATTMATSAVWLPTPTVPSSLSMNPLSPLPRPNTLPPTVSLPPPLLPP